MNPITILPRLVAFLLAGVALVLATISTGIVCWALKVEGKSFL